MTAHELVEGHNQIIVTPDNPYEDWEPAVYWVTVRDGAIKNKAILTRDPDIVGSFIRDIEERKRSSELLKRLRNLTRGV